MTKAKSAFRLSQSGSTAKEIVLFTQKDFQQKLISSLPFGLCAGLLQVWCAEVQSGRNAMGSIQRACPALIIDVLLAQASSIYFKRLPSEDHLLTSLERSLLKFKYEIPQLKEIEVLLQRYNVTNCFELDLVLGYGLPLIANWQFETLNYELTDILCKTASPCFYLIIIRYFDLRLASKQTGHRCGLAISDDRKCRFYDPSRGEIAFSNLSDFSEWFRDYWIIERWDEKIKRGRIENSPVSIYQLGGEFESNADRELVLSRRPLEELMSDLKGIRLLLNGYACAWITNIISECTRLGELPQ